MTGAAVATTAPTFTRGPEGDDTTGTECVDLARSYGIALDDWQADLIRAFMREAGGTWAASQCGLVLSRQQGKGQMICARELFGLFVLGEQILHTAHQVKTSSDAFRRLWRVVEGHPDLLRLVRRHSEATGSEFVELHTGARVTFTTRSANAGRGLSIDLLVLDEAEDMPATEIAALAPTTHAKPSSQQWFAGTAPGATHDAESFLAMRQTAHDGLNDRLAWAEWSAEYGADLDDEALWERVNPAVGCGRIPLDAIRDDRSVLPADVFRAERLSMFVPAGVVEAVFDPVIWSGLYDVGSVPVSDLAVGLDAPPSRESATVCVAGRRPDGLLHVEWYETGEGITWLPAWVAARLGPRVRAVVVDGRNATAELDWHGVGVRATVAGTRDVTAAAGGLVDLVADRQVRHTGQVELTRGVLAAVQRPMLGGQGFAWERRAPGSSVLLAASLALWGVDASTVHRPKRAPRGQDDTSGEIIVL